MGCECMQTAVLLNCTLRSPLLNVVSINHIFFYFFSTLDKDKQVHFYLMRAPQLALNSKYLMPVQYKTFHATMNDVPPQHSAASSSNQIDSRVCGVELLVVAFSNKSVLNRSFFKFAIPIPNRFLGCNSSRYNGYLFFFYQMVKETLKRLFDFSVGCCCVLYQWLSSPYFLRANFQIIVVMGNRLSETIKKNQMKLENLRTINTYCTKKQKLGSNLSIHIPIVMVRLVWTKFAYQNKHQGKD